MPCTSLEASPARAAFVIDECPVPTAGAFPVGVALGPDANIWFTENAANQIGRG
jgi:streptogramin lyase